MRLKIAPRRKRFHMRESYRNRHGYVVCT